MDKKEWRQQVLGQLRGFKQDQKVLADQRLLASFLANPLYHKAQTLATYLSLPHEVVTEGLIEQALADGKQVLVPKVLERGQMVFVPYDPDQLVRSAQGILEPAAGQVVPSSAIDLIHVPGLVFNREGYRIGYGGGFYDRYLADYEGATVATLYADQLGDFVPEAHDLPVKELIIDETMV